MPERRDVDRFREPLEVAVVGLGAMGSMIIAELARHGAHVTGYEALDIGSDRTGFGGDSRLFRVAYQEGAAFTDLLVRSRERWLELNRTTGLNIFLPCGAVSIGNPRGAYMSKLLESLRVSGCKYELVPGDALAARFPQHHALPGDIAVFDAAGGVLRSDLAVIAAVEAAKQAGAEVVTRSPVEAVQPSPGGGWQVWSKGQTRRFDRVVISAGAWAEPLVGERLRRHVSPSRILLLWYCARDPDEFAPNRFPAFVRDSAGIHMYGAPTLDGATVKIAGVNAATPLESPEKLGRDLTAEEVNRSNEAVRRFLPGLHPSCVRGDAYMDLRTTDRMPLLGWDRDRPGVYLVGGFSGRGFKMAPAVGEAVAGEILTGHRSPSIRFAALERFD